MNAAEFSDEFDVLYNNIMSNNAPGLNEYEKSVFLTKAQNEIIKNYFNPKGNKYEEGFDDTQKRQIDFSNLETVVSSSLINIPLSGNFFSNFNNVYCVSLPKNIFFITNEVVDVIKKNTTGTFKRLQVIPLKFDEYTRLSSKPYKQPLKNQAWRLNMQVLNLDKGVIKEGHRTAVIIVGHNYIKNDSSIYFIRYIRKPYPIILEDLGNNTIDGKSKPLTESNENTTYTESPCELDSEIHPEILQRAVELAKAAYIGDINSQIQMGQRSE